MALNIKNRAVEALATEISKMTGESKTEAIRRALEERKRQLSFRLLAADHKQRLRSLLETEIWPRVPAEELGRRQSKREQEELLGLGPDGV
jgi:antitoxin VapB